MAWGGGKCRKRDDEKTSGETGVELKGEDRLMKHRADGERRRLRELSQLSVSYNTVIMIPR